MLSRKSTKIEVEKKENLELIKKALDVLKETSNLEKAAEILNINAHNFKTYMYSKDGEI